jgi:chromate reductase
LSSVTAYGALQGLSVEVREPLRSGRAEGAERGQQVVAGRVAERLDRRPWEQRARRRRFAPDMSEPLLTGKRVLVISGSTRAGSTNTAFCRTAALSAPPGVRVDCYPDVAVLPHFNPDLDQAPLPAAVSELRAAIAQSDAVVFCTPEYAGTLPGSFKNLLDWTVGGTEMTGKPVAWVKVAADPRRGEGAHATLATVLGYVQARVVEAACVHAPIARDAVGADGLVEDPTVRSQITAAITTLLAPEPTG